MAINPDYPGSLLGAAGRPDAFVYPDARYPTHIGHVTVQPITFTVTNVVTHTTAQAMPVNNFNRCVDCENLRQALTEAQGRLLRLQMIVIRLHGALQEGRLMGPRAFRDAFNHAMPQGWLTGEVRPEPVVCNLADILPGPGPGARGRSEPVASGPPPVKRKIRRDV